MFCWILERLADPWSQSPPITIAPPPSAIAFPPFATIFWIKSHIIKSGFVFIWQQHMVSLWPEANGQGDWPSRGCQYHNPRLSWGHWSLRDETGQAAPWLDQWEPEDATWIWGPFSIVMRSHNSLLQLVDILEKKGWSAPTDWKFTQRNWVSFFWLKSLL